MTGEERRARREAEAKAKAAEQKKRQKKRRKKRKKIARAMSTVLLATLVIAALVLVYTIFKVERVTVSGNATLSTDEVLMLSEIETGTNIWLIDARGAVKRLESDPHIGRARIDRVYPSLVRITVTERVPRAAIYGTGSVAVIDSECFVMDICSPLEAEGLMQVMGIGSEGFQIGQMIGDKTDFNSRTLVSVISAIDRHDLAETISSVDISNALSTYMYTYSGYRVQLGQPDDLDEKFEKLAIVLKEIKRLGYEGGTINLSAKGDPTYSHPSADDTPVPQITPELSPGETPLPGETPEETPGETPGETAQPDETPGQ